MTTLAVDIGCARYGGDFSIERLIQEFKPDRLYGFDPNGELVVSQPAEARRVEGTRWVMPDGTELVLEQKAAWIYDGEIGYISQSLGSTLTDRASAPKVPCFDLSEFIYDLTRHTSAAPKIILKMDAEGCEYELLDHLINTGANEIITFAWIEWHPFGVKNHEMRRKWIEDHWGREIVEWRW